MKIVVAFPQDGTSESIIWRSCSSGGGVPRDSIILDVLGFEDFLDEFSNSKGNFPLGNYVTPVETDIPWKIMALTGNSGDTS